MSGVTLRRSGITLLDGFSLRLPDPGLYLICGPCASGKSLLGRLLAGRLRPDRGQVLLDGTPLYRARGLASGVRALLTPPAPSGPLFHAAAGSYPDAEETLYRYLDIELWRAGSPTTTLHPFWEVLERHIPAARKRSVASLSHSELCLAHIALGAAIPARVVVLDGQLGGIDKACHAVAQRLLGLITEQDRFVILTGPPDTGEIGRATRFALAGGLPVSVVEKVAAEEG